MNAFKRAFTNIKRQPIKNGVLLLLVLILATTLSGAISVRQAINNTEESMLLRTPAVATLSLNAQAAAEEAGVLAFDLGPEFWQADRPTIEELSAVGNLPYVRAYDTTMSPSSLFSQDLAWAVIEIDESQLPSGVSLGMLESSSSIGGMRSAFGGYVESFEGRGVANPDLTDIDAGLIELVAGRTFTQAEIDNGDNVVIISQLFARANDLSVGSIIEFDNKVFNYPELTRERVGLFTLHWHEERFVAAQRLLEFEVIGMFDIAREFNYQNNDQWVMEMFLGEDARLQNRIYMPISVAEDILIFESEGMQLILDEMLEMSPHYSVDDLVREPVVEAIYILYDPRDLDAFQDVGSAMLPGFWEIIDLRGVETGLISSMDTMRGIADFILIAAACATIAVLTLIITLLLRDRRYEVGVYMALGEKKGKIIFQFLTEIVMVSTVAIIIALFIGNSVSATISRSLLEQNLIGNAQDDDDFGQVIQWELILFNPGELSIEETLAMYDTSLDTATIVTFVGVGVVVILLSTVIPIAYVVKLEPKKVLLG